MFEVLSEGFFGPIAETQKPGWAYVVLLIAAIAMGIAVCVLEKAPKTRGEGIVLLCLGGVVLGGVLAAAGLIGILLMLVLFKLEGEL